MKKQKWVRINHLDKGLNTGTHSHTFLSENIPENIRQKSISITKEKKAKKCKCMNCKKSLTGKKPTAKFCGLKCKNHYNGKRRTKANQQKRVQEQKELKKIIPKLPETDLAMLIIYKADEMQYADHLHQKELQPSPEWIKQIRKVLLTANKNAPQVEFTTLRAKQLIREITKINTNSKIRNNGSN